MHYIFDHFYQAPTNENSQVKGSGIGLALIRELVNLMNGQIFVESQPQKGTVFTVRLPYSKNAFRERDVNHSPGRTGNLVTQVSSLREGILLPQQADKNTAPKPKDAGKPTILIVEDNYDLRSFLIQSLSEHYNIVEGEHGKEGFELAKKHTPDLIVSDIMMPHMDGIELCSRLKNNIQTSHIPIILLTSKAMVENWVEGLESGADGYIPKPFNLSILNARIKNLIRSRQQLKLLFGKDPTPHSHQVTASSLDEKFLDQVYEILEKHYTDQEFSQSQFANQMCMSRSLLYKKIKSLTDMSVTDFINFFKLKKATSLLLQGGINVSEVAYKTGFSDPKYFSRLFRKFYGMSPSHYANLKPDKTGINRDSLQNSLGPGQKN